MPIRARGRFRIAALLVWVLAGLFPGAGAAQASITSAVQHDLAFAAQQIGAAATSLAATQYPYTTTASGAWATTGASGWTSGFFPGSLWLLYQRTGDSIWRTRAQQWQAGIASQRIRTDTHDLGFMIFTSFGNGYRLTGDAAARQVVLTAAGSLAQRYNPVVGCIKSWDGAPGDFKVIIDNMMNLELLFWASKHGGSPAWYDMAVSHALRTREQHVRPDGSTYHLVNYNPATGAVKSKGTVQGYADDSTWSRGQAWAVYGFTMTYRETGDSRFLETARATADYFIAHLPADSVPYWDFQAPNIPNEPRDSSAAAIAASGLLELSQLDPDSARRLRYLDAAQSMLLSLSTSAYLAEGTPNRAVLLHGTRNKPGGSYDTGLVWGDYYFLEALLRYTAIAAPGTLAGRVLDHATGAGIAGATVSYSGGSAIADAAGEYRVEGIASSAQIVRAAAPGYAQAEQAVDVPAGGTISVTFELAPLPAAIEGSVRERATDRPIGGAAVSYSGGVTLTNALGQYRFEQVAPGAYRVTVSASGYISGTQIVAVHPGAASAADFALDLLQAAPQSTPKVWMALIARQ